MIQLGHINLLWWGVCATEERQLLPRWVQIEDLATLRITVKVEASARLVKIIPVQH